MFAELLATTCYSFLRGASQPEEFVQQAASLGLSALAICDRDGLYGVVKAFNQAKISGQRFITGAELTFVSEASEASQVGKKKRATAARDLPTLALLCQNHAGYQNLCRLLTLAHADQPKGESALELGWLEARAAGLFALIPAPRCPSDATTPNARYLESVKTAFGERA